MKFSLFVYMKNLLTVILSVTSFMASAQIQVTDSLIESFLKTKIIDISQKIYKAALDGEVTAFYTDSLSKKIFPAEISKFGNESILVLEDDLGPIDSTIIVPFDVEKDIAGVTMVYSASPGDDKYSKIEKLNYIGILHPYILYDIDLGTTSLFYCPLKDLEGLLDSNEMTFLLSVISQNKGLSLINYSSEMRHFVDPYDLPKKIQNHKIRGSINDNYIFYESKIDLSKNITFISKYNLGVLSIILNQLIETTARPFNDHEIFFSDNELTKKITKPLSNLVCSRNYESGWVIYSDVSTLDHWYTYSFYKLNNDIVIKLHLDRSECDEDDIQFFVSYNSIKALYPKHDRIVMEAFFNYLFEGR